MPVRVHATFLVKEAQVNNLSDLLQTIARETGGELTNLSIPDLGFEPDSPQPLDSFPFEGSHDPKRWWYEQEGFKKNIAGKLAGRFTPLQLSTLKRKDLLGPGIGNVTRAAVQAWQKARGFDH